MDTLTVTLTRAERDALVRMTLAARSALADRPGSVCLASARQRAETLRTALAALETATPTGEAHAQDDGERLCRHFESMGARRMTAPRPAPRPAPSPAEYAAMRGWPQSPARHDVNPWRPPGY